MSEINCTTLPTTIFASCKDKIICALYIYIRYIFIFVAGGTKIFNKGSFTNYVTLRGGGGRSCVTLCYMGGGSMPVLRNAPAVRHFFDILFL